MARPSLNNISKSGSFLDWIQKTNDVINLIKSETLTASANTDTTIGDAILHGSFDLLDLSLTDSLKTNQISSKTISEHILISKPILIESEDSNVISLFSNSGPKINLSSGTSSWVYGIKDASDKSFIIDTGSGATKFSISVGGLLRAKSLSVSGIVQANSFTGILNGNVSSVANMVYTEGNQTINGIKTFSSVLTAPTFTGTLNGNASSVTNGIYTTGSQTIGGVKTFSSQLILSSQASDISHLVRADRLISTSGGLTGGGDLTSNRTLSLSGQALALHNLSSNGYLARTSAGVIVTRNIAVNSILSVENSSGIIGNTLISANFATESEVLAGIVTDRVISPATYKITDNRVYGRKWTYRTTPIAGGFRGIAFNGNVHVAVGYTLGSSTSLPRVMTSPDGIIWNLITSSPSNQCHWRNIIWANNQFVAISGNRINTGNSLTANRIMTSPDGFTWTGRTIPADLSMRSIAYGAGIYVTVGDAGPNNTANRILTSPTGVTWTIRTSSPSINWASVKYGNGKFVALGNLSGTDYVGTSSDGITWVVVAAISNSGWNNLIYENNLFVAIGNTGSNRIMTSPDGITWTLRSAPINKTWKSISWNGTIFLIMAYDSVEYGETNIITSPDGINWFAGETEYPGNWNEMIWNGRYFVGVADNPEDLTDRLVITSID